MHIPCNSDNITIVYARFMAKNYFKYSNCPLVLFISCLGSVVYYITLKIVCVGRVVSYMGPIKIYYLGRNEKLIFGL